MKGGKGRVEGVIYPLPAFVSGSGKILEGKKNNPLSKLFFCLASSVGYPELWLAGLTIGRKQD